MKRNEIEMKRNELSLETSKDVSCIERSDDHSMLEDVFIELPLNDGSAHQIIYDDVDFYEDLYPAVDVRQELRKMVGWLDANPSKRKTPKGVKRFINTWLSKAQDQGGTRGYVRARSPTQERIPDFNDLIEIRKRKESGGD